MDSGGTLKMNTVERMAVGSQARCRDKHRKESRGIKCHSSKQKRYFWIVRFNTINPHRHTLVMCKRTVNQVELIGWAGALALVYRLCPKLYDLSVPLDRK